MNKVPYNILGSIKKLVRYEKYLGQLFFKDFLKNTKNNSALNVLFALEAYAN